MKSIFVTLPKIIKKKSKWIHNGLIIVPVTYKGTFGKEDPKKIRKKSKSLSFSLSVDLEDFTD